MTTLNPALVPTITPGNLFNALATTDGTLAVRFFVPKDPVFYGSLNRPISDIVIRQLIIAKAVDGLSSSFGHGVLFPYLIQPELASGSGNVDVPLSLIWDLHLSFPTKWSNVRLAKIKRISGTNGTGTSGFTGILRLIFTGIQQNSNIETALVMADYHIDSNLTYQCVAVAPVTTAEEAVCISPSEDATVAGYINFRTLDTTNPVNQNFLHVVAPPTNLTTSGTTGHYTHPAIYELLDSSPTDPTGNFSSTAVAHGTGMLEAGVISAIPALDSDVQTWLNTFNYPFNTDANLISTSGITIPFGLFKEFNITAPAGDEPTGDVSGTYYPVWISRIERLDVGATHLRFYFATYNVTDAAPSTQLVEFATLDLLSSMTTNEVAAIVPITNLQLQAGTDAALWGQHFGRGHVVLSNEWGGTSATVADFFNAFALISDHPADISFSKESTRLSSFGISRIPKYTPTIGQAQALIGSTARRTTPINPSDANRYVTEQDQGLGSQIDLEAQPGITPQLALSKYGYTGSLCHKIVKLTLDATQLPAAGTAQAENFYLTQILPRLTILLGRAPVFGDIWYTGVSFNFFNGDTWQSP